MIRADPATTGESTPRDQPVRYDRGVVDAYVAIMGNDVADPATSALLELLGDVRALRVLDLPCGEGRVARELARRGATVVGVDLADAMLTRARAAPEAKELSITYVRADGIDPRTLDGETFDRVVCNFGLSDVDDLDALVRTFVRVLRPGGALVYSILHPCFPGLGTDYPGDAPPGRGYFTEGWWADTGGPSIDPRTIVGTNHRTVATYFNAFARAGLRLDEVAEPEPGRDWAVTGTDAVPMFLVAHYGKPV
jgi:2-polyprenyl-3-methyl-5-hydroxy-6-metoxy-1,4-benzoquinol methylase